MSKHTPGPWRVNGGGKLRWISADSKVATHSDDVNRNTPSDNMVCESVYEADARLIAAAPELLEALRMFVVWYGRRDKHDTLLPPKKQEAELAQAMRTTAKAEGTPE